MFGFNYGVELYECHRSPAQGVVGTLWRGGCYFTAALPMLLRHEAEKGGGGFSTTLRHGPRHDAPRCVIPYLPHKSGGPKLVVAVLHRSLIMVDAEADLARVGSDRLYDGNSREHSPAIVRGPTAGH